MLPLSGSLQIHIKIVLPEKRLFLYKQCTWSEGSVDDDLSCVEVNFLEIQGSHD